MSDTLFETLVRINQRPEVYSRYTADALWTSPDISEMMLRYHLDSEVDLASRRVEFIERSFDWITERFALNGSSRVIDLGCGKGDFLAMLAEAKRPVIIAGHSVWWSGGEEALVQAATALRLPRLSLQRPRWRGPGLLRSWVRLHVQTLVGSLGRLAEQPVATAMTLAVIGIALALPASLYLLVNNLQGLSGHWEQGVELSVYLDPGQPVAQLLQPAGAAVEHLVPLPQVGLVALPLLPGFVQDPGRRLGKVLIDVGCPESSDLVDLPGQLLGDLLDGGIGRRRAARVAQAVDRLGGAVGDLRGGGPAAAPGAGRRRPPGRRFGVHHDGRVRLARDLQPAPGG